MTDKAWFENVRFPAMSGEQAENWKTFMASLPAGGITSTGDKKLEKRKLYSISAKQDQADIYLYDDIGDSWDGLTAKMFAADLKKVASVKTLNIYINSAGGSVFDGVAIFNQIKRHKARKNVVIDGIAASIASVVAMAGDSITIAENGFMMIHNAWAMAMGDAAEFRKMADELDKVSGSILNTYAERTGQAPNVISEMMAVETWMDAEEAVELGFADEIGSEAKMAARFDLSSFHNVPEPLAAKVDVAKNPPKLKLATVAGKGLSVFEGNGEGTSAGSGGGGSCFRAGERLAARLNRLIDDQATEDRTRADIIEEMADAAGIDAGTVNQILNGSINCPPRERLEGFAEVLDVTAASLIQVAESDGCNYGSDDDAENAKKRKNPCKANTQEPVDLDYRRKIARAKQRHRKAGRM